MSAKPTAAASQRGAGDAWTDERGTSEEGPPPQAARSARQRLKGAPEASGISAASQRGVGDAWTDERGTSEEGPPPQAARSARQRLKGAPEASGTSRATDLVERYAAALVSAVPDDPDDDGFYGPRSVTWRLSADLSAPVAGLRSVLLQALHPLAMAGVDQHSDWRTDPVGRLAATAAYTATVTYGDRASASRVARRVRAIHTHVRGTDTVTGRPYAASDPALLLWVHAALVDSVLAASALFGTPPADEDADRFVGEMSIAAELLGVPREIIPASVAALQEYISGVRPELRCTPAAAESMGYMLDPEGMGEEIAELWLDIRDAAVTALPGWARDMYGYPAPPAPTPERRTEIRQTLGVFDTVFMAEPGVLEARQRITLRMRKGIA